MESVILGIFISCLIIQWHTARTSHKLDEILYEMKSKKEGAD